MATGRDATAAVAAATGLLPATVFRAARTLREAGGDLWPMAGKGGGKAAAPVQPRHMTNLALALTTSPITDAPAAVRWMRGLLPHHIQPNGDMQPVQGAPLGDVLDSLIVKLRQLAPLPKSDIFSLIVIKYGNGRPIAHVRMRVTPGSGETVCEYFPPKADMGAVSDDPAVLIQQTHSIPFGFFELAARLCAPTNRDDHGPRA